MKKPTQEKNTKLCVGMLLGPHGVKGQLRLKSFTEVPEAIETYVPLTDETGQREFVLKLVNTTKDQFVVRIKGVDSCEAAEALRGTHLYAERSLLPKLTKREFYAADLVGAKVHDQEGVLLGEVRSVHNYGGGPFIEIGKNAKDSFMLPFNDDYVPSINLEEATIVVQLPTGWLSAKKDDAKNE